MSVQPNAVIETVDQAAAIRWLEKNYAHQRTIRNRDVARYATMMREGRWKLTHQGIAFSDTGKLLDGQHRLWAIIEAGVPVKLMVTRGLSEDSFVALDQNRVRSFSDLAADDLFPMPDRKDPRQVVRATGKTGKKVLRLNLDAMSEAGRKNNATRRRKLA